MRVNAPENKQATYNKNTALIQNKSYHRLLNSFHEKDSILLFSVFLENSFCLYQVVYAMGPRPPFSKCILPKIKIMMDERSVDIISGNFS